MKLKLSTKGQVVIPQAARAKYQLEPGDQLNFVMEDDGMRLVPPRKRRKHKMRLIKDPITGMTVATGGPGAPMITTEMVKKLLEDFP